MKPYYEHAGITIYHGDCRDVMEEWEGLRTKSFDLLLTDPPYGIKRSGQTASDGKHGGRKGYEDLRWDDAPPETSLLTALCGYCSVQIIWGGQFFALPPSQKWLVWDKGQRIAQSDGELAWTSMPGALRIRTINRMSIQIEGAVHPTQKPVELMTWCIHQAGFPKSVLDPFMGSGTTLVAAKQLGIKAVGIEQHEKYCELAVNRLSQDLLPLSQFEPANTQNELW